MILVPIQRLHLLRIGTLIDLHLEVLLHLGLQVELLLTLGVHLIQLRPHIQQVRLRQPRITQLIRQILDTKPHTTHLPRGKQATALRRVLLRLGLLIGIQQLHIIHQRVPQHRGLLTLIPAFRPQLGTRRHTTLQRRTKPAMALISQQRQRGKLRMRRLHHITRRTLQLPLGKRAMAQKG